jgi:soluble cytochrome b562
MSYSDIIREKAREIERKHPTKDEDADGYREGQEKIARMIDNERAFRSAGVKVA